MAEDESEKPAIRFTARIVVNPRKRRTDLPEFCIEMGDDLLDLRPLAAEVLADYPDPVPVDADTVARFAVKHDTGKYIRVGEYPPGIERQIINDLAYRVLRWRHWKGPEPETRGFTVFPRRQFACGADACPSALSKNGENVAPHEIQRLPLNGCWGLVCSCRYRLVKRDGRLI